ncbi:Uncharacterized conserved secreted protein [Synechococcus sp. RCC307]|nr:Uncharacterized conserved secreted protein [Synechococcus sp. RCC307]
MPWLETAYAIVEAMLKPLITAGLLLVATAGSALAQVPPSQVRAANLARMEAERINGGLSKYFTANCMHRSGGGNCLVNESADGYLFNFLGGAPGWEVNQQPATVQTKILIGPEGNQVKKVIYNGAPQ